MYSKLFYNKLALVHHFRAATQLQRMSKHYKALKRDLSYSIENTLFNFRILTRETASLVRMKECCKLCVS